MKNIIKKIAPVCLFFTIALSAFLLLLPSAGHCGNWRVAPIMLDFDKGARTGSVTVYNEGTEKLSIQMKAMEWSQDANGKDNYSDTRDIIFFPKIMTLEKGENKIIRAGIRIPATAKEKTFRLFIEEIPEPKKKEGSTVAIAIRFGVPIFAKPLREELRGEIGKTGMTNGKLSFVVGNTGNIHFRITSISASEKDAKGNTLFSKELDGWYLLNGASRTYTADIPKEKCIPGATLEIAVKADGLNLSKCLNLDKSMCVP